MRRIKIPVVPLLTCGELTPSTWSLSSYIQTIKPWNMNNFCSYCISRAKPRFIVYNSICLESVPLSGDGKCEALFSLMQTWRQRWEWSSQSSAAAVWSLLLTQRVKDLQSAQVKGIVGYRALDTAGHQWTPAATCGPVERYCET